MTKLAWWEPDEEMYAEDLGWVFKEKPWKWVAVLNSSKPELLGEFKTKKAAQQAIQDAWPDYQMTKSEEIESDAV